MPVTPAPQGAKILAQRAYGKERRKAVPRSVHGAWVAPADRSDPVALLRAQDADRFQDLVPIRWGRMSLSPFTFYRGAAKIMAADLKDTPRTGLAVQLCGDAHLSNFGVYASPERQLLFDVNDFDETLPGPFEYDIERLAASFVIAARNNGLSHDEARTAARTCVTSYREAMAQFAEMGTLAVWYSHLRVEEFLESVRQAMPKQDRSMEKRVEKKVAKARTRDSLQALGKLAELVDGEYRIVSQPPIVVPLRDVADVYGIDEEEIHRRVHERFDDYRTTLEDDRRHLLERFEMRDLARKVVGVGSVGTRAFIVLFQGRDAQDPLFLQVKEATASVYEDHLPRSRYQNHGQRVVLGQRLMQAASDIFLGWTTGADSSRHFYWRQLRDMKASAEVESLTPTTFEVYAHMCGWTLARAHARSGDPIAIASYLGASDRFDRAVTDFAERYADQNERDYSAFLTAIRDGRLDAEEGV